ncbi:MAG: hypothetical protein ABII71_05675 [Candidatus Micrarchaeota archaeon]
MISSIRKFLGNGRKKKEGKSAPRRSSGTISVAGKVKDAAKLCTELRSLSMFQDVANDEKAVNAMIVESMDRARNPYKFIRFSFGSEGAQAQFSIPPEVPNPAMRELEVMRTVFTLLSLLESKKAFLPDREDMYSKVVRAFELSSDFMDAEPLRMKYELGRYEQENSSMKSEVVRLKEENEGLNHQFVELEKRSQKLEERIRQLETLTDNELDREIVSWVEEHYGRLNEQKFCNSFSVSGSRLEERLDALSKRGVIRLV